MRVLIVFHGRLPGGPYPAAGMAVRAYGNGLGLTAHGAEVVYASRRRDLEGPPVPGLPPVHPFEGKQELLALARAVAPDLVLVEGTYDVGLLEDLDIPIAVDLFAPRVLEAQWQDADISREMLSLMGALTRADYFLVTSERQKYFYVGALALAGVDCREERIAVVPIAAVARPGATARTAEPTLVSGGVAWPWQDSSWALGCVAARLEQMGRGTLHLLRGPYPLDPEHHHLAPPPVPPGPRVVCHSLLDHPDMCALLTSAWCVVDLTARNLEREMALSFRQVDALACGTPLLIGDHQPLAAWVQAYRAGWVVPHGDEAALNAALDQALEDEPEVSERGRNALRLASERLDPEVALARFAALVRTPSRRRGRETVTEVLSRRSREADTLEAALAETRRTARTLQDDLKKKDQEIAALVDQVHTLMDVVGKLSNSLEAATHQQESTAMLAAEREETLGGDLAAAHRALAAARREVAKKTAELEKALAQRDDLEAGVARLETACQAAQHRLEDALQEAASWRARQASTEEQLAAARSEITRLRGELGKKQEEIQALWETRDRLNDDLADLSARLQAADAARVGAETRARRQVEQLEAALNAHREACATWEARCSRLENALQTAEARLETLTQASLSRRLAAVVREALNRRTGSES